MFRTPQKRCQKFSCPPPNGAEIFVPPSPPTHTCSSTPPHPALKMNNPLFTKYLFRQVKNLTKLLVDFFPAEMLKNRAEFFPPNFFPAEILKNLAESF